VEGECSRRSESLRIVKKVATVKVKEGHRGFFCVKREDVKREKNREGVKP